MFYVIEEKGPFNSVTLGAVVQCSQACRNTRASS
jgi:hypothetical protein